MEPTPRKDQIRRRLAVGSAALLIAAGAGGVIALRSHAVQAASVSARADPAGGHADPAGSVGQDGNFNN